MHPAVELLKVIANGPKSARDFTQEESCTLMRALLDDAFTESQLGALLLIMRRKGETRDEMIGLVKTWESLFPPVQPQPDSLMIGAPFDGKKRSIAMTPMAMLILAQAGHSICAGGSAGLGPKHGTTLMDVTNLILAQPAYAKLTTPLIWDPGQFFPIYTRWKKVRNEVGLRGFIHTIEKCLNPYKAHRCILSVFHNPYVDLFLSSSEGRARQITIIKGDEGSPDLRAASQTAYVVLREGQAEEEGRVTLESFDLPPVEYRGDTSPESVLRFWSAAISQPDSAEARWLAAQCALLLFGGGHGAQPLDNLASAQAALESTRARCA